LVHFIFCAHAQLCPASYTSRLTIRSLESDSEAGVQKAININAAHLIVHASGIGNIIFIHSFIKQQRANRPLACCITTCSI